jgi:predicted AlkP superfamily phosphohydrolase/phosphomutase
MCYRLGIHPQTLINIAFKSGLASMNQKVSFGKKKAIFSRIGFTFEDVDWNRTRAFSFGSYGPIYLNSVRNHPNGIVGEDQIPHLREEIMNKLREITDPERGIHLIDKIWQREELYHGPFAGELPDISYSMDNFSYTSSSVFAMPSYDIFSRPLTRKSGDHRLEGVLIAYGKGVASGSRIENANIVDVAPMILDFLNVEVPEEMDGKPLPEVFR